MINVHLVVVHTADDMTGLDNQEEMSTALQSARNTRRSCESRARQLIQTLDHPSGGGTAGLQSSGGLTIASCHSPYDDMSLSAR